MSSPDLFANHVSAPVATPPPPARRETLSELLDAPQPNEEETLPPRNETLSQLLGASKSGDGETVRATPYPHQVGGHGQLKKTHNGRLLKPMYEKELRFYLYIYSDRLAEDLRWLRRATPKFFGRSVAPSALPPSESSPAIMSGPRPDLRLQWRMHLSPSLSQVSPWAHAMGNRVRKKSSHCPHSTIAMEDLNQGYIFPSVLDLKIGTRHYDDDATEEKRARHRLKSEMSTSAKYGIRFTGTQSYKRMRGSPGVLEFRDKYYGRKLKGEDLIPQMTWFFHNGASVRVDCIRIILEKLHYIFDKVRQQKHFKFYSSSLLLVYEGASRDLAPCNADVRMIDFAHTQWKDTETEPDLGYVLGIENLIRILKQVVAENKHDDVQDVQNNTPVEPARSPSKDEQDSTKSNESTKPPVFSKSSSL